MTPKQKALQRRVDEVLHYMWDPIGVAGEPEARDEYEDYLPGVLELLWRGADEAAVAEFLEALKRRAMGPIPMGDRVRDTAEALVRYREWIVENVS